jgi:hypothetical protein
MRNAEEDRDTTLNRCSYLYSFGFTARRAMPAEVSKASRLTHFLQASRSDLPAEVSKASRLTPFRKLTVPICAQK